jgi:hypothetical protein
MDPYVSLPKTSILEGRQDFILEKCRSKRVLHLGCVDTGLLQERFQSGELMHLKLAAVAAELWGVDVNVEGIAFLQERGVGNLIVGDVCALDEIEALRGKSFDVIVASEVVEHLQNPGLFLQAVQSVMTAASTQLIITVPNAFRIDTLYSLLGNVERVHPDHNFWFSYHTITNLVQKSGLVVKEVCTYSFPTTRFSLKRARRVVKNPPASASNVGTTVANRTRALLLGRMLSYLRLVPKWLLVGFLLRRSPFFGDGLVVVCTSADKEARTLV